MFVIYLIKFAHFYVYCVYKGAFAELTPAAMFLQGNLPVTDYHGAKNHVGKYFTQIHSEIFHNHKNNGKSQQLAYLYVL